MRTINHWNNLSKDAVDSPILEIFLKVLLDKVLDNLVKALLLP